MYEISVTEHFSAAHSLRGYIGKCANIHGHTWQVDVIVSGNSLNSIGMLADFSDLKQMIKEKIQIFDHHYINEIAGFTEADNVNPTAENIAYFLYQNLKKNLISKYNNVTIKEVKVWESDRAYAVYKED